MPDRAAVGAAAQPRRDQHRRDDRGCGLLHARTNPPVGAITTAGSADRHSVVAVDVQRRPIAVVGIEPLNRIGDIPDGGLRFVMPNFSQHLSELLKAGVVLALLGAIDSLLTSLVADNITQTNHDSNRELIGQGIANTASGLLSGLPGAGATMRTVINIKSGGATPISGMTHSVVLLLVLLEQVRWQRRFPQPCLPGS